MKQNVMIAAAAIALGALFLPTWASSLELDVGVSAGAWLPGDVRVHAPEGVGTTFDYTMTTETTFIGRAFVDLFAVPWLGGGVYVNAAPVRFTSSQFLDNWDGEDHIMPADGITMLEFGGGLKARLRILEGLYLKPGVSAGFRMTLSDSPDARSYAVGVNGSLEIWYEIARKLSVFMDAGLLAQPFGGVPDVTLMDFGPLFYVGGGVGF
jgi:hypothetical protein